MDLLTSCVLQTHGVQLAKKKDEAPQETTDFVAMSFTDSEAGTPMKKKGTQQTGEASRGQRGNPKNRWHVPRHLSTSADYGNMCSSLN